MWGVSQALYLDIDPSTDFIGNVFLVKTSSFNNVKLMSLRTVKVQFSAAPADNDEVMFIRILSPTTSGSNFQLHYNELSSGSGARTDALPVVFSSPDPGANNVLYREYPNGRQWHSWKATDIGQISLELTNRIGAVYSTNISRIILEFDVVLNKK